MKVGMEIVQYMPLIQVNFPVHVNLTKKIASKINFSRITSSLLYFRIC